MYVIARRPKGGQRSNLIYCQFFDKFPQLAGIVMSMKFVLITIPVNRRVWRLSRCLTQQKREGVQNMALVYKGNEKCKVCGAPATHGNVDGDIVDFFCPQHWGHGVPFDVVKGEGGLTVLTDEAIPCKVCGAPSSWGVIDGDIFDHACPKCRLTFPMGSQSFAVEMTEKHCYSNGGCATCPGREGIDFCQPGNQKCPKEGLPSLEAHGEVCHKCGASATWGMITGWGPRFACDSCTIDDDTGNLESIPVSTESD